MVEALLEGRAEDLVEAFLGCFVEHSSSVSAVASRKRSPEAAIRLDFGTFCSTLSESSLHGRFKVLVVFGWRIDECIADWSPILAEVDLDAMGLKIYSTQVVPNRFSAR